MFTKSEKRLLGDDSFTIIRNEEKFIELQSKDTGHCWVIFKKTYEKDKLVVLYHKHTVNTDWYHEHWNTCTVKSAIASIKAHDGYVLKYKEGKNNGI